jgi:diaminohydroxyphosphoribosylaminopyrimidine deaminase / 5-amino-6-(5-phosphoribosylamino)uracil reductase
VIHSRIIQELKINSFLALGYSSPNPPVACVITDEENNILSSAYTQKAGLNHAEREAYQKLGENFNAPHNLYITLEPCSHFGRTPPCIDLILSKNPKKVYLGELDPNPLVRVRDSLNLLKNNNIPFEFSKEIRDISKEFLIGFFFRIQKNQPRIFIKSAVSKEGFFKSKVQRRNKISNSYSDTLSQCIRQSIDAIIVGSTTVKLDNPKLNFRGVNSIHSYTRPKSDIYFSTLIHIMEDQKFIDEINKRNNQPYRIFVISGNNFPDTDFFIEQKKLGIDKTIFIVINKIGHDSSELIKSTTTNPIYYSTQLYLRETILEISNFFQFNNLLIEGGNSLYKLFYKHLEKEDKIIEIISTTSIEVGEKPIWHGEKTLLSYDSFQINNDLWKIKGV